MKPYPLALVALLCGHAGAALITATAPVGWGCAAGTGGFEVGCNPSFEPGVLTFTYNSGQPDSDPSPLTGIYSGSVSAFRMTVQQTTRLDLVFTLTQPGDIRIDGSADPTDPLLRLFVRTTEPQLGAGSFSFVLSSSTGGQLGINTLPGIEFWKYGYPRDASGYGVGEADWLVNPGLGFAATQIPEPRTAWLLLVGIGAATATRRRTLKGRDEVQGLRT